MPTYVVNDTPTRVDNGAATAVAITNTGSKPVIVQPSGRRLGPGEAFTFIGWSATPTTVTAPGGQVSTVDVTLTAGTPAAGPGPGALVVDPNGRSMTVTVSGATLYSDEALLTAVTFPRTITGRTSYYAAAPASVTAVATLGGVQVGPAFGTRLQGPSTVEWKPGDFNGQEVGPGDIDPSVPAADTGTYAAIDAEVRRAAGVLPSPVVASRPIDLGVTVNDAGRCTRLRHVMAQAATDLRLVYGNYQASDSESGIVAVKVRAGIEYPAGTFHKVHFPGEDGNRDVTLQPGQRIVSDPLPIDIPAGATIFTNTLIVPTSAGSYPVSGSTVRPGGPEASNPASTTDYTTSANPGTGAGQFAYGPLCVLGVPATATARRTTRTLGIISDSFVSPGTGDNFIGNVDEKGWAPRAYNGVIGRINVAQGGEQLLTSWAGALVTYRHRFPLVMACDWVMEGLGTNDFNASATLAAVQAGKIGLWGRLASRGIKVRSHTIAPRTTSTDSWATTTNQTAVNARFGPESGSGSDRHRFNTWLRAGAPIVAGAAVAVGTTGALLAGQVGHPLAVACFDLAAQVEVFDAGSNTWVWKAGYTADGIHPSEAAYTAIAAAETPAIYV